MIHPEADELKLLFDRIDKAVYLIAAGCVLVVASLFL